MKHDATSVHSHFLSTVLLIIFSDVFSFSWSFLSLFCSQFSTVTKPSVMGNLFKKAPKPENNVSQQDLAVLQLKQLRDKIKQTQKRVTTQMDKDREVARKLLQDGKKDRALLMLKKKKRMEKSILDMDNKLEVLEKMVADIEFSQIELQLVDGLKTGNEALKQLNSILSIENIESILDETKESAQKQKEISQVLTQGKEWTEQDEEELEAELNELVGVQETVKLPEIPVEEPVVQPVEELEPEEEVVNEETRVKEKKPGRSKKEAVPAT